MIRIIEYTNNDPKKAEKIQKQIDRLKEKKAKLEADLAKRTERKQKTIPSFDKLKDKTIKEMLKAISDAINDNTDPEALSKGKEAEQRIESLALEDWYDFSKITKETMSPSNVQFSEPIYILRNLIHKISDLNDTSTPEYDLAQSLYRGWYHLDLKAEEVCEMVIKITKIKAEIDDISQQIESNTQLLSDVSSSEEYLNYAPPEFWDFVEKATNDAIQYWESQDWKETYKDYRTGKTMVISVTEQMVRESYQDAAQETIYRVSHKAGRIKEVRWMKAGTDLRAFDGTYVCENKTVTAQTIIAGGWNIQKEHTRVLIK